MSQGMRDFFSRMKSPLQVTKREVDYGVSLFFFTLLKDYKTKQISSVRTKYFKMTNNNKTQSMKLEDMLSLKIIIIIIKSRSQRDTSM